MSPLHALVTGLLGVLIFLYGFLPMKVLKRSELGNQSLPDDINGIGVNVSLLYKPAVNRLVLMVIDALRDDFVTSSESSTYMPYLSSVISHKEGFVFTSMIEPPTVTLPRIKAITMGLIPNYADMILNVLEKDASSSNEESIVGRAYSSQRKVIFYGDDTWLRLFPESFLRAEGTTSFYVSDYTEVDDNVTRHLDDELGKDDWDVMILHYLGLDHIGHLHGPFSHLIPQKLMEMDLIIQKIHQGLMKWGPSTLLVVCGDHGMKDTGGHGGASLSETQVPLVFISSLLSPQHGCLRESNNQVVNQRDLAPTLSALLGLPPPSGNLGCSLTSVLRCFIPKHADLLYTLHVNAWQVAALLNTSYSTDGHHLYQEASKLHSEWIYLQDKGVKEVQGEDSSQMFERIIRLYSLSVSEMTTKFAETLIKFDYYAMFLGGLITWQAFLALILDKGKRYPSLGEFLIVFLAGLSLHSIICSIDECSRSSFCKLGPFTIFSIIILGMISLNLHLIVSGFKFLVNSEAKEKWKEIMECPLHSLFVAGGILHALSLTSSSFIEEEHQTWQFLCISVIFLEGMLTHQRFLNNDKKDCDKTRKVLWMFGLILLSHRVLRDWNRTGDKWGSWPDLTDWISKPENVVTRSLVMGLSLVALIFVLQKLSVIKTDKGDVLLTSISAFGMYAYRTAVGDVSMVFSYPSSRGITEFHLFLVSLLLILVYGFYVAYKFSSKDRLLSSAFKKPYPVVGDKKNKWATLAIMMQHILTVWVLFCTVLKRPCDVIVVVIYLLSCHTLTNSLVEEENFILGAKNVKIISLMHIWLGMAFYFHQGNSNSLASIDLQAGYVGQESYNPINVGILLFCHTFSMPITSLLLIYHYLTTIAAGSHGVNFQFFHQVLYGAGKAVVLARLLPLTIYLPLITFQRHHLFIWTVFSPKLIYEASLTLATYLGLIVLSMIQLAVSLLL